jgi:hypothetical protein
MSFLACVIACICFSAGAGVCVYLFICVSVYVCVFDLCTCCITWPYAIARVLICIKFSVYASMCACACVYLLQ